MKRLARAERKLGQLLLDAPNAKPGPKQLGSVAEPNSLAALGIDRKLSMCAQRLATLATFTKTVLQRVVPAWV